MSINQWGPATWDLFHTLASKINETDYNTVGIELFAHIKIYVVIYHVRNVLNTQGQI